MPVCNICIDELKEPVCLPCGHVFCGTCIVRTVNSIKPATSFQPCPTCRTLYSIISVDPSTIPPPIRPHLVPSIRRLYLGEADVKPLASTTIPSAAVSECGRLAAENKTLRVNCAVWKRRAELHAAATLGLLNLARLARDCNQHLKNEKDDLQRQCNLLKRKLEAEEAFSLSEPIIISEKLSHTPQRCHSSKVASDLLPHSSSTLSSEDTELLAAACAPYARRISVSRASSAPAIIIPNSFSEPLEQNLPPSLKRRRVDDATPPPCPFASAGLLSVKLEMGTNTNPPLALRKRKELML
ncbi:hypothetical protein DFH05DRAFT_1421484 [Lentinula detonsa]|uniref:RING-type domain-containing protein n=1 Tax=Lentinula detonsa TaxID=2804962 RepID=A0A9W8NZ52_9AGAR|nr:hypothetical protein DFH05DRAFT_1421484 [Lentinula detonsa]